MEEKKKEKAHKTEKQAKCDDRNCPIHNNLKTKEKSFKGTVISDRMQKSATIMFERTIKVKKYERYERKRTKLKVHNPTCINAKVGDLVRAVECRPISKTINFVIVKKLGKGEVFHMRDEDLEQPEEKAKGENKAEKAEDKEEKR